MKPRWRSITDTVVTCLIVIAAGLVIYRHFQAVPKPTRGIPLPHAPVSLEGATLIGDQKAPAAIVVYTDFLCPYCKTFGQQTLPFLLEKYVNAGLVLLAIRQLPVQKLHPFAFRAAEAAVCGARQDKFMVLHDALFAHQRELAEDRLEPLAVEAGLTLETFRTCLGGQATDSVKQDLAGAAALKVSATPSFLLGQLSRDGRLSVMRTVVGAQLTSDQWQAALDDTLNSDPNTWRSVFYAVVSLLLVGLVGFWIQRGWSSRRAASVRDVTSLAE